MAKWYNHIMWKDDKPYTWKGKKLVPMDEKEFRKEPPTPPKEEVRDDPRTEKEERYARYEGPFLCHWRGLVPVGGRHYFANDEERAEYKRAWNFWYNQQPEVKAAKKAYMAAWRQFPEVKVYEKAYRDAYRAVPGVRERDNALRKLRHARAKERAQTRGDEGQ